MTEADKRSQAKANKQTSSCLSIAHGRLLIHRKDGTATKYISEPDGTLSGYDTGILRCASGRIEYEQQRMILGLRPNITRGSVVLVGDSVRGGSY